MRILMVTRNTPARGTIPVDKGGGGDDFVESFLRLPSTVPGLAVDVVTLPPQSEPIEPPRDVSLHYVKANRLHHWLWIHREAKNPLMALGLLILTSTLLARECMRIGRESNYDLVYAVGGPIAGLAGIMIKRGMRIPLAMHFQYTYRFAAASWAVRVLAKLFYDQADALIGNCAMLGRDATALGVPASRCHWVLNWVDQSVFRSLEPRSTYREKFGIQPDQTAFYFGGRFCHTKHVDRLIGALRGFEEPRAVFIFAGDGVLSDELHGLARENPNIRVLSTLPHTELAALHAAADVQFWGSVDVDYPGLVVMGAMSSGLPVFTSSKTMNPLYEGFDVDPRVVGAPKCGRLFPPDFAGIHAAIREAIERREELASTRTEVASFARQSFGYENALRLIDILEGVAQGNPRVADRPRRAVSGDV